ncbi:ribosome small subunit-dependent GTPase A [Salinispira pacifica]|uniref:Small ribosomal subunit biogenesis GTPase RsgA n=1 Tax=Salinispira pacifica TaxID=1307761 RepID=V5WKR7_9SPIO|nr:ribosome small subunit-dependent GTPase A [Salinispira pacifica]AHC16134.1 EngC-like putative GTPase [Salinispira pacifica]
MKIRNLNVWGWTPEMEENWKERGQELMGENNSTLFPARVIGQEHHVYLLAPGSAEMEAGEVEAGEVETGEVETGEVETAAVLRDPVAARISGHFESRAEKSADYPAVGDWVAIRNEGGGSIIEEVLPRSSGLQRWAAGRKTEQQWMVSNLDYLLLVFGLDGGRNFLESMLERSLTTAWNSGAKPVIVLNKLDCADTGHVRRISAAASEISFGVPVCAVSAHTGEGISRLTELLRVTAGDSAVTLAMLGKSGVGKSAIVNALQRESGSPAESLVRAKEGTQRKGDLQGRHTTTSGRIYPAGNRLLIADLPGLRELKIWGEEDTLDQSFPNIHELAEDCRFRDCRHEKEPGCAVKEAISDGRFSERRFQSYRKLLRELAYLERRREQEARKAAKR